MVMEISVKPNRLNVYKISVENPEPGKSYENKDIL